MSFNGSGTFVINSSGQPVVTNTVISSTAFNALTADLGTGLSTTITRDGQTTTTAKIPFAFGLSAAAASNFPAGTVAAPGLYLSTDTGTGLYRIGANNDGFAVSGAKVLDIASTGLAVTGTLSASGVITATQGISSSAGAMSGQILQTVKTDSFTDTTTAIGTAFDITGLSQAITPSSASNRVLVKVMLTATVNGVGSSGGFIIVRDATAIGVGNAAGNRLRVTGFVGGNYSTDVPSGTVYAEFIDSPATTSSTTYKVQGVKGFGTDGMYVNRAYTDTDSVNFMRGISTITVQEIK